VSNRPIPGVVDRGVVVAPYNDVIVQCRITCGQQTSFTTSTVCLTPPMRGIRQWSTAKLSMDEGPSPGGKACLACQHSTLERGWAPVGASSDRPQFLFQVLCAAKVTPESGCLRAGLLALCDLLKAFRFSKHVALCPIHFRMRIQ
jgi:hypothetical protein